MLWFVSADLSSTGERDSRDGAPSLFMNRTIDNALRVQPSNFVVEAIAHQIELVNAIIFSGMNRYLGWGKGEDEPSHSGIYARENRARRLETPGLPLHLYCI